VGSWAVRAVQHGPFVGRWQEVSQVRTRSQASDPTRLVSDELHCVVCVSVRARAISPARPTWYRSEQRAGRLGTSSSAPKSRMTRSTACVPPRQRSAMSGCRRCSRSSAIQEVSALPLLSSPPSVCAYFGFAAWARASARLRAGCGDALLRQPLRWPGLAGGCAAA
jgi:hypothetical protein